jgi:glycogen debranching enzyme
MFWTPYPATTLDLHDPDYNARDEYFSYWNGRVWPPVNWLLTEALCRGRNYDVARTLAMLTVRLSLATGEPLCMENYHPQTGQPYATCDAINYLWGGLAQDLLLRRVMGLQPNVPRDELYINPLLNEDASRLSIQGMKLGTHTVDVAMAAEGRRIRLTVAHRGRSALTLVTSAGRRVLRNMSATWRIAHFDPPHWLDW